MTTPSAIAAILAALLLGAMSPGPSFVLVARNAIGLSRSDGIATAIGMGVGGSLFAGLALCGLYTLLSAVGWLYAVLKIAGGIYLLHLAFKIFRGARESIVVDGERDASTRSLRKSFRIGLSTQLSNPKTAVVYGSIFAALLPHHPAAWCYVALPPLVFGVEAGWYCVVALCFSSQHPRNLYLRSKKWVDRLAAGAIAGLGLRLICTAQKTGL
ncbi:MAG: LysE family translocator [Janthinobacterium lividum]